jgi:hypothetical protein
MRLGSDRIIRTSDQFMRNNFLLNPTHHRTLVLFLCLYRRHVRVFIRTPFELVPLAQRGSKVTADHLSFLHSVGIDSSSFLWELHLLCIVSIGGSHGRNLFTLNRTLPIKSGQWTRETVIFRGHISSVFLTIVVLPLLLVFDRVQDGFYLFVYLPHIL